MYTLIVIWPLIGSIIGGLFGKQLGEEGVIRVTTTMVGLTALGSIYSFYEVGLSGNKVYVKLGPWIESIGVEWGLMYDSLTVVMLIVVTVVSTLVHIYSGEYMEGDNHRGRFMSYLSLFTFFMLILVTADNYLQMFVGWEGVGLCSYLLINFWYTRIQANKAAIQAMLVNRIADLGLCMGIAWIYNEYRSIEYTTVFSLGGYGIGGNGIGILLFIGAIGKSAQLGLHVWLPNAMEGPTPVSALIHAATMVTAGVFLLARSSPLLEYMPDVKEVITIVGGMTAFFAATVGVVQNDMKKVIAYSTASQLGYMVMACGMSAYSIGVFHLANHAFFKGLLFLSAGAVIHGMSDEQDMRRMGGIVKIMPVTYAMIIIGSMALMGMPFLTGFYSKDVILEVAYAQYNMGGSWAHMLGKVGAICTAFYSMRLLQLTFLKKPGGYRAIYEKAHEPGKRMLIPMLILSVGSIFIGYLGREMFVGVGTDFWGNALFTHPENMTILEAEYLPASAKNEPVILAMMGGVFGILFYIGKTSANVSANVSANESRNYIEKKMIPIYRFFNKKWMFDKVYVEWIVQGVLDKSYKTTYKGIDRGILEMLGPDGLTKGLYEVGEKVSRMQSGHIYHYAMSMMLGTMFIIFWICI